MQLLTKQRIAKMANCRRAKGVMERIPATLMMTDGHFFYRVQGDYIGFNAGNGEKLSYMQAEPGQASCLAVA